MIQPTRELDRLTVFAFAWAWAETMQPLNTHMTMTMWSGWILPLATILLLMVPGSTIRLTLFLTLGVVRTWHMMPFVPNHVLFMFLINLTLLASILQQAIGQRSLKVDRKIVYERFASVARVELIMLYAFSFFAKLNYDFINPDVSGAVALFDGVREILLFLPEGAISDKFAIYGTIAAECLIPILLVFNKTRTTGLLVAVAFHLVLAIHPLWATSILTFTMVMYATLILFASDELIRWAIDWCTSLYRRVVRRREFTMAQATKTWIIVVYVATIIGELLTVYPRSIDHEHGQIVLVHRILVAPHLVSCILLYGVMLICWFNQKRWNQSVVSRPVSSGAQINICWFVAVLLVAVGTSPYLGLRTTPAFTMFSNLKTEGGQSNHMLVGDTRVFGFQDRLVNVLESNDPILSPYVGAESMMTLFELKRICSRDHDRPPARIYTLDYDIRNHIFCAPKSPHGDAYVRYRLNGVEFVARKGESNPHDLFRPHPWLSDKLLSFRPILGLDDPTPFDH